MFISDNYQNDKLIIEYLEDFWMDVSGSRSPSGYNIASGRTGRHVPETSGGHGAKRLETTLNNLMSHGFTKAELWGYVKMSEGKIERLVSQAHEGETFSVVQDKLISKKLFSLIDEGFLTPGQLSPFFRGFTSNDIFNFLHNNKKGKVYLKSIIATVGAKHDSISWDLIMGDLGLQRTRLGKIVPINMKTLVSEMGGLKGIERNYVQYLKYLAFKVLQTSNNAQQLLTRIRWTVQDSYILDNGDISLDGLQEIDKRINQLFGTTFDRAKAQYSWLHQYLWNV